MKKAAVLMHGVSAGFLEEITQGKAYAFEYVSEYHGPPISLTMPLETSRYEFDRFPPFFEGLLPEGLALESLLKEKKIDKTDYFEQLLCLGQDLVGAVTVEI
jgi:serine/threonine-protein kinase HipA